MSNRLTAQQVDKQLQEELISFYNTVYTRPIPAGFIQLFKDAVFHIAPNAHKIRSEKILDILKRKESELLTGEVGMMCNTILDSPLDWLFADLDIAMKELKGVEDLVMAYNQDTFVFKSAQEKKRKSLMSLIQPASSGMKIVGSTAEA